jgi:hypothetical protein
VNDSSRIRLRDIPRSNNTSLNEYSNVDGIASFDTSSILVDYAAADKLEAEIQLLMLSGYNRDAAIQILLERRHQEQSKVLYYRFSTLTKLIWSYILGV